MKKRLQGLIAGILIGILVSGSVFAATGSNIAEIVYNNIKVYKNNELCEMKDANGKVIEPFIYNDTTYMPVRATANLADMGVTWDGDTKSVYLWDEPEAYGESLMEICPPEEVSDKCKQYYSGKGESFLMGGRTYSDGLTMEEVGEKAYFEIYENCWYLECIVGHTEYEEYDKSVSFFVNGLQVKEVRLTPNCIPVKIRIPISEGSALTILTNRISQYGGGVGIGNITVQ